MSLIKNKIDELNCNHIYICGAGASSDLIVKWMKIENIHFDGYYDQNRTRKQLNGKPIYGYDCIDRDENAIYIISSSLYRNEIIGELENKGIDKRRIISFKNSAEKQEIVDEVENYLILTIPFWNKNIQRFHNIYQGKKAFIIGNGPSLTIDDLNKLQGEISFGMNSIVSAYKLTQWRPTYYLCCDPITFRNTNPSEIWSRASATTTLFTTIRNAIYADECDYERNIVFMKCILQQPDAEGKTEFSDKADQYVVDCGTTVYIAYQLAAYMGIKTIYLIGVDSNFNNVIYTDGTKKVIGIGNTHAEFIEEEHKEEKKGIYKIDDIECAHKTAKAFCESHGIKIFNATRGGKLEVFPRVNLDSII